MRKSNLIFLVILALVFNTCTDQTQYNQGIHTDFEQIKKRGKLIAVTNFNSTDYFIYKGSPMGFQFELLKRFAEQSDLQLELIACNDIDDVTSKLLTGKCDVIAISIPVTSAQGKYVSFTEPLMQSKQVLVQKKPDGWEKLSANEISDQLISTQLELARKTIVVQKGTAYAQRIKNISQEIGQPIDIVQVPEDPEQLIQFVAGGEINYTICDERVARVNQKYYPQLDISMVVSFPQNLSWAVRRGSEDLLVALDAFIKREKANTSMAILHNKYYKNEWANAMVNSDYYTMNSGRISPYDDDIRKLSDELQWDWRLLAALIYNESSFKPSSKSHRGAYGLMQIMPSTAEWLGSDSTRSKIPATNMRLGVKLLKWLDKRFQTSVPDKDERAKFVLAAYNIGIGHILDAQNLTEKYHKDKSDWEEVREFLINKSQVKYYSDPIVKFGYCSGKETYSYVNEVINSYQHYKNIASLN